MLWGDCPEGAGFTGGFGIPEVPGHPESLDPPGYLDYPDYLGHLGLPALVFTESHRAP